jgi:glutamate synthase (NADPH/NADH) large chain
VDEETFERELYVIRRRIEKARARPGIGELYIASLSCRSIIYKGMMLAEQVAEFYPDLKDERFESAFAIYHQRYSTNTFPQWWLAQPFRMLAHNGEINTLKGNVNWMKSHEIRMASGAFGDMAEDIKPIVPQRSRTRRRWTRCSRCWCGPGATRRWPRRCWCRRLVEAGGGTAAGLARHVFLLQLGDGALGRPRGAGDDRRALGLRGLDRNGLRPMRYVVTGDGLVIAGSEAGMVPTDEATVRREGRAGPGQMMAVDMAEGKLFHDTEIKDKLAASAALRRLGRQDHRSGRRAGAGDRAPLFEGPSCAAADRGRATRIEELEQILAPMAEDGKEALASMGDDTPSAVLSKKYRPLSHFFRQNFSQVTNPPIDSLREYRVMSLKTRFGNLKNVLDEDSSQTEILVLDSPFVGNAQFDELVEAFNAPCVTDRLHLPGGAGPALREGLERIRGRGRGRRALGRGAPRPDRSGRGRTRWRCR